MTAADLGRRLHMRGFDRDAVEAVLVRLRQERYLDDRRYAERFLETARENGRYVGGRLRQELARRGVPRELLTELLAGPEQATDETALARQVVQRRYGGFDPACADDRERRRIAGFLQRRGFRPAVIRSILWHVREEVDHDG